jgi:hypothetical protein
MSRWWGWFPGASFLTPKVAPYVTPEVYGGVPGDTHIGKEVALKGPAESMMEKL